jgi:hypothetical protein
MLTVFDAVENSTVIVSRRNFGPAETGHPENIGAAASTTIYPEVVPSPLFIKEDHG